MRLAHDPGEPRKRLRDLSETEMRERIRKIRVELEVYRLPSPERLGLLEKLVLAQHELIAQMTEKTMRA